MPQVGIFMLTVQCYAFQGPAVTIYSSSADGDRLVRMPEKYLVPFREPHSPVIVVDDRRHFQRIDGFGATFNEAGIICLNSLSKEEQAGVLRMLFDPESGAGFTVMKSPMASCDFASAGPWYSYDETPGDTLMIHFSIERDLGPNGLVSFIKKASAFGKFQIETTMDFAPDWMMYGLREGEKHVRPEYYSALSRYYSRYVEAYASNGIVINYLNPFNEPENTWYSNVTYKEIGELIKHYIAPRFKTQGLSTKIQLCESASRPEGLQKFPAVLDDPEASRYISSLTVHGYDWDEFGTVAELHTRYPAYPIWMTEVCYARVNDHPSNEPPGGPGRLPDYSFSDGEFWGNMIMNDLKNWVSAWVYWNMILDENGGPWVVSTQHGDPDDNRQQPVVIVNRGTGKITYTGLYYYLSHFSRFIHPGAVRINVINSPRQLNSAGFLNPGRNIVLNIINNGQAMDCNIRWHNKMVALRLKAHSISTLTWNEAETSQE